jgi:hypothetical protein
MEDTGDMPDISPELALQLIALRDALLETSWALQDWLYVMDWDARELARESTNEILKRHGCHLGPQIFGDCL